MLVVQRDWIIVSVSALMLAVSLLLLAYFYSVWPDFQVYRWAVRTWLAGGDVINARAPISNPDPLPWVYPPFALPVLAPLGLLPFAAGIVLIHVTGLVAVGTTLFLTCRHAWPTVGQRGAVVVAGAVLPLTLVLEPVHATFGQGQINLVLMGLVALDCLVRTPFWPRGVLVGLAAAIKLTPAAFLLFFLLRGQRRAALTATVTAFLCTAAGFALDFRASVDYWFRRGPAADVAGHQLNSNQSIMGGLARLDLPPGPRQAVWLVLCLVLVAVTAQALSRVDPPLALSANGLLAVLVSPTSWSNHWVWVVPGVVLMCGYAVRRPGSRCWLALGVVTTLVAVTAPFHVLPSTRHRELSWTPLQHVIGDSYALLGIVLLVLLAVYAARIRATDLAVPRPA